MERDQILALVLRNARRIVPDLANVTIDTTRPLKEAGVDSLDVVDIVSQTMQELKVKVPRSELAKIQNLDGLVDVLHRTVLAQRGAVVA